jgi:hypothetical protein
MYYSFMHTTVHAHVTSHNSQKEIHISNTTVVKGQIRWRVEVGRWALQLQQADLALTVELHAPARRQPAMQVPFLLDSSRSRNETSWSRAIQSKPVLSLQAQLVSRNRGSSLVGVGQYGLRIVSLVPAPTDEADPSSCS